MFYLFIILLFYSVPFCVLDGFYLTVVRMCCPPSVCFFPMKTIFVVKVAVKLKFMMILRIIFFFYY